MIYYYIFSILVYFTCDLQNILATIDSGDVESDNFPNNYAASRDTEWTLSAGDGEIIHITFTHFDVEYGQQCEHDYLEVLYSTDQAYAVKLCGRNIPVPIYSTSNQVTLRFHTDPGVEAEGWQLHWEAIPPSERNYSGEIQSENYPGDYPTDMEWHWTIIVEEGSQVKITFLDFYVETLHECRYDYVQIWDGKLPDIQVITKVCGADIPREIYSTGNIVRILFYSDSSVIFRGWHLQWETFSTNDDNGVIGHLEYIENLDRTWTITVSEGMFIELVFSEFVIQYEYDCSRDRLEIIDGSDSEVLALLCGIDDYTPIPLYTKTNNVSVVFHTDSSNHESGWLLQWKAVSERNDTGELTSDLYPVNNYRNGREWHWTIVAKEGSLLQLWFHSFVVEIDTDCGADYLQIFDGNMFDDPLIQQLCGNDLPETIYSTGNGLHLLFHSDATQGRAGWHLEWAPYTTMADNGSLAHLENVEYMPNLDRTWTITVNEGMIIEIIFYEFSVEYRDSCNRDYVQIKDNIDDSNVIALLCGDVTPVPVYSWDNSVVLLFHSNADVGGSGWMLEWYAVEDREHSGIIQTDHFDNGGYPDATEFHWTIVVEEGLLIRLIFIEFDIIDGSQCSGDYLSIQDGDEPTSTVLNQFCEEMPSIPHNSYSTGNKMRLHFLTHSEMRWKVKWEAFSTTADVGRLGHQNYFEPNLDRIWNIVVSEGATVKVVLTAIDLEGNPSCSQDYIQIQDGLEDSSPIIGTFCGTDLSATNPVYSTDNSVRLIFHSDGNVLNDGWALYWTTNSTESGNASYCSEIEILDIASVTAQPREGVYTVLNESSWCDSVHPVYKKENEESYLVWNTVTQRWEVSASICFPFAYLYAEASIPDIYDPTVPGSLDVWYELNSENGLNYIANYLLIFECLDNETIASSAATISTSTISAETTTTGPPGTGVPLTNNPLVATTQAPPINSITPEVTTQTDATTNVTDNETGSTSTGSTESTTPGPGGTGVPQTNNPQGVTAQAPPPNLTTPAEVSTESTTPGPAGTGDAPTNNPPGVNTQAPPPNLITPADVSTESTTPGPVGTGVPPISNTPGVTHQAPPSNPNTQAVTNQDTSTTPTTVTTTDSTLLTESTAVTISNRTNQTTAEVQNSTATFMVDATTTPPVFEEIAEIPEDVPCPDAPLVENSISSFSGSPLTGNFVTYRCKNGYNFNDGSESNVVACVSSTGRWSHDPDDCQLSTCSPVPVVANASPNSENNTVNTTIIFNCDPWYIFPDGQSVLSIQCMENELWSHNLLPSCELWKEAIIEECPLGKLSGDNCSEHCLPPAYLENMYTNHTYTGPDSVVDYICMPGYIFPDGERSYLSHCINGKWTDLPYFICNLMVCPEVPEVSNATADTTLNVLDTLVTYTCNPGYIAPNTTTEQYILCEITGLWSEEATGCIEIECEVPVDGNAVAFNITTARYNQTLNYVCNDGFRLLDGRSEAAITCSDYKQWDGLESDCQGDRCPPLPSVNHVTPSSTNTTQGINITMTVDIGYKINDTMMDYVVECGSDLQWNGTFYNATAILCSELQLNNTEAFDAGDNSYNTTVLVQCSPWYHFEDRELEKYITCNLTGLWQWLEDGSSLSNWECIEIVCTDPPRVGNATTHGNIALPGENITYHCRSGYYFTDKTLTKQLVCQENGLWGDMVDSCSLIICPAVPIWFGIESDTTEHYYNSRITYICKDNFTFVDESVSEFKLSICDISGTWSPGIVQCVDLSQQYQEPPPPVEAENAEAVGMTTAVIVFIPFVFVIILDVIMSIPVMIQFAKNVQDGLLNVKQFIQKTNKLHVS